MTKFEYIGAQRQYASANEMEANRNFNASCERCVYSGRCWHSCKGCAIKTAHEIMISNFALDELNREMEERLIRTNRRLGLA